MSKEWFWTNDRGRPRPQVRVIGKQEGTVPKKLRGKRVPMTNLNDRLRGWRDIADGEGPALVRQALYDVLNQFQHHLDNPAGVLTQEEGNLTAAHYLKLCATVDALKASIEASENSGRSTMKIAALKEILGDKA